MALRRKDLIFKFKLVELMKYAGKVEDSPINYPNLESAVNDFLLEGGLVHKVENGTIAKDLTSDEIQALKGGALIAFVRAYDATGFDDEFLEKFNERLDYRLLSSPTMTFTREELLSIIEKMEEVVELIRKNPFGEDYEALREKYLSLIDEIRSDVPVIDLDADNDNDDSPGL